MNTLVLCRKMMVIMMVIMIIIIIFIIYELSRCSAAAWLYPPTSPSAPVNHAPGVTSRFWLARRRPRTYPHPQPVCARRPSAPAACSLV